MNNTGKILTAVVAGAAAGAVLGLLFAPDKGSETRKKIREKTTRLAEDVKDKFRRGKEKLKNLEEEMEEAVREKAEQFA
jgi:gas vesicle protein